jgi:hypothetical protein
LNEYITAEQIAKGKLIDPIQRIKLMSPDDWEILIEEWLDATNKYVKVERIGGAGDMGRDVIAYIEDSKNNPNYQWDCYQCKHYDKPLTPSDIWSEFGKLIYYTYKKEFPIPNNYYFVAPHGLGTKLSTLLDNSENLKRQIKEKWDKYCKKKITDKEEIILENDFLEYFNKFDFSIFDKTVSKTIIEEHKKHENHLLRFGGGLPSRNLDYNVPPIEEDKNLRYIIQLIKSYNSDSEEYIDNIKSLMNKKHKSHLNRARKSFYSAEELRAFSRDTIGESIYINFQDDIFEGIINTAEEDFENAFEKVKATENESTKTIIDSNPLKDICKTIDRKGVCHQLVEDKEISWVEDE